MTGDMFALQVLDSGRAKAVNQRAETKARTLENTEVELEPNTAAFYAVLCPPSTVFDAA
jgi:hypothetical protein